MSEPSNAALEREPRVSGKRRRPSGEPPPLPRKLGVSGMVWVGSAAILFTIAILVVAYATLGYSFDRWNSLFLQRRRSGGLARSRDAPSGRRALVAMDSRDPSTQ